MNTVNEDRYPIPPNFTLEDYFYARREGAKYINDETGKYFIYVNDDLRHKLDTLWAINSTQK